MNPPVQQTPAPRGNRVALVLGAAVWSGERPSPTLARRTNHAIDLYKAGAVDSIVACGGIRRHPPSEARIIARLCLDAGLPPHAIHLEEHSTTTRENLANALAILRALDPAEILLVTDLYHMPRARLIGWQLGLRATASPTDARGIGLRQWLRSLLREGAALAAALFKRR